MPPRSLRRGDRQPKPGAVFKGCPRPKALRFTTPFGGTASPYGDGHYSGNIVQGGVPLQPQDYLLDGITPMPSCIVVTGAATVAPDATSGAAVFMAHNIALVGATASLSAATNCKGLLGFVDGLTVVRGGAHLHMDRIGKAGNFGDLSPDMLLPRELARRIATRKLKAYVVLGEGAAGGAQSSNPGTAAVAMQTGGGGAGAAGYGNSFTNSGGKGGPCCGGAGSGGANDGATTAAGPYGGPGTAGYAGSNGGGGAGDPPGQSGLGAGGGLVMLFSAAFDAATGCIVSSDGADGAGAAAPGGSAGGGCVVIVTKPGGYVNYGTVRANGGAAVRSSYHTAGPGGVGSVNIFALAA